MTGARSKHKTRTAARIKAREAVAFKRAGGVFGAVCRFLFATPGA